MAHLVITNGEDAGTVFHITAKQHVLGRGEQSDFRIKDRTVSRTHALLFQAPDGEYRVKDQGSTSGLYVNGQKVAEAGLAHKAVLRLGVTELEFLNEVDRAREGLAPQVSLDPQNTTNTFNVIQSLNSAGELLGGGPTILDQTDNLDAVMAANKRLRTAYEISDIISSTFEMQDLYQKILAAIFKTVKVERAAILLVDEKSGQLREIASRDQFGNEQALPFSHTIVQSVIKQGESLLLANAQDESGFDMAKSIISLNIRSAMCVPIRTRDKILGVINADASGASLFSKNDLQLLTLVGNQAGIAIQNAALVEENIKTARLAAVGHTVASLAHCIKNILGGLRGAVQMMDEGLTSQEADIFLAAWPLVKGSQQRISELVMNMLDYSKDRQPAYETADLREHMQNIVDLMKERAEDKEVKVFFEYDPATPPVECDPMAIYRATLNLMTNAIDAVHETSGEVRLKVQPGPDDAHLLIHVIDNGGGIPPEMKDKLFEAFQSTKASRGTGLGLCVTKKIITEHRGEIVIDSEAGRGTTFSLKLPLHKPAAPAATA